MKVALKQLRATLASAYDLAPLAVVFIIGISVVMVSLVLHSSTLRVGAVLLVVFLVAVFIYAGTNRYGEAALALAAGLFSVYSVDWTTGNFVSFVSVWIGFSVLALLISSIRLAAENQQILRDASLILAQTMNLDFRNVEAQLQDIAKHSDFRWLGPIERAKVLRIFCVRKLPLQQMLLALKGVESLSVITRTDPERVARFVADSYRVFDQVAPNDAGKILDILYHTIRDSAVPADDFFSGFESSRHLVLSRTLEPREYLRRLSHSLQHGVLPHEMGEQLKTG